MAERPVCADCQYCDPDGHTEGGCRSELWRCKARPPNKPERHPVTGEMSKECLEYCDTHNTWTKQCDKFHSKECKDV